MNKQFSWQLDDGKRFVEHENEMLKERIRIEKGQNNELWASLSEVAKERSALQNDKRILDELEAKHKALETKYREALALKEHLEKDQVETLDSHEAFRKMAEEYKGQAETEKATLQYQLALTEEQFSLTKDQLLSFYPQIHDNLDNVMAVLQTAAKQDRLMKEALSSHFPEIHSDFRNLMEVLQVVGARHSLIQAILSKNPQIHQNLDNMAEVLGGSEVLGTRDMPSRKRRRR